MENALNHIYSTWPLTRGKLDSSKNWPLWKIKRLAPQMKIVTKEKISSIQNFLSSVTENELETTFQAWLIQDSHRDTVCLAIDHSLTDAAGAKYLCYMLAAEYTESRHKSVLHSNTIQNISRSQLSVTRMFSIPERIASFFQWRIPSQNWQFYLPKKTDGKEPRYLIHHMDNPKISSLKHFGCISGASINDLLLAAYYCALIKCLGRQSCKHLPVQFTIDLRRFLPATNTPIIANLSSTENIVLHHTEDNTFANALMQVCRQTKLIKRNRPGLPAALGLNLLFTGGYRLANSIFSKLLSAGCFSGRANPILTNFGEIDEQKLNSDFVGLEKAYLVGPNFMAPGLLMSASSFRNQLTLSVGYNQSIISDALVSRVLNETVAQLESAASDQQNSNSK